MVKRIAIALALACGCGNQPILHNVPQPSASTAAGIGALAAAAATLAAPEAGAKASEKQKKEGERAPQGVQVRDTVPAAVFDRLDEAHDRDGGVDASPSTR